MKSSTNKIYFNPAQRKYMSIRANSSCIIAARGIGKSEGIDAQELIDNVLLMPRSLGAIITPTYTKLLRNTLPAVLHGLSRLNFRKHSTGSPGHFTVGTTPPKHFKRPYIEPSSYENCMVFWNGTCVQFISQDGVMSANSMSLDWVIGFEAKFLNKKKIDEEIIPANRGNKQYFGDCFKHHGIHYSTDRPTLESGLWLFDLKNLMDTTLYSAVVDCYDELTRVKQKLAIAIDNGNNASVNYYNGEIKKIRSDLNLFRANLFYYDEFDSLENIDVLGVEWFFNMKRVLPPYLFLTSVMNMDVRKVSNCFYPFLSEKKHCYVPDNSAFTLSQEFGQIPKQLRNCLNDGDLRFDEPLIISFDYNSAINNIVVSQVHDNEHRTVNSMFVKTPRKLSDLVQFFCDYYAGFLLKEFVYYYDSTAVWETASQSEKYFETVLRILDKNKWTGLAINLGNPERHDVKYQVFAEAFTGNPEYLSPSFNQYNNEELILAMKQAKTRITRNGFEKDKSLEKKEDSINQPDEFKTHITDAWDTNYLGCLNHPHKSFGIYAGSHAG